MWSHVSNHAELMSNDVNKLPISTFIHKTIEKLISFSLCLSKHNANQWRMKLDWYFVLRHDVMMSDHSEIRNYFISRISTLFFYLCWPVIYSVLQSGKSIHTWRLWLIDNINNAVEEKKSFIFRPIKSLWNYWPQYSSL